MFFKTERGFSLLELSLFLAAAAILTGVVVPSFVRGAHVEAARKCATEITQLQESARVYRARLGTWPVDIQALKKEGYLSLTWDENNPYAKKYSFHIQGARFEVRTEVPAGIQGALLNLLPMSTIDGNEVVAELSPFDLPGVPVGGVLPWAAVDLPSGWIFCDGREISRVHFAQLFGVIGVAYGNGDGVSTFNVPDLRGRVIVGKDDMGGSAANIIRGSWGKALGGTAGEEEHVLTVDEIPPHSHLYGHAAVGGRYDGSTSTLFRDIQWRQTGLTGGGRSHNNIQPSMAMNWIIKY